MGGAGWPVSVPAGTACRTAPVQPTLFREPNCGNAVHKCFFCVRGDRKRNNGGEPRTATTRAHAAARGATLHVGTLGPRKEEYKGRGERKANGRTTRRTTERAARKFLPRAVTTKKKDMGKNNKARELRDAMPRGTCSPISLPRHQNSCARPLLFSSFSRLALFFVFSPLFLPVHTPEQPKTRPPAPTRAVPPAEVHEPSRFPPHCGVVA